MDKTRKVIAVDIDGFVTNGERFWEQEPTPKLGVIEKVNNLYKQGHVVIYHTGRHPSNYENTYAWLVKYGCYFHALRMGKLAAEHYLDDKNANIDDL